MKPVHLHLPLVVDRSIGHKPFLVEQQTQRSQGCDIMELVTFSQILLEVEVGFSRKMRKHMQIKKKMFALQSQGVVDSKLKVALLVLNAEQIQYESSQSRPLLRLPFAVTHVWQ